jgi:hypothetical protein
MSAGNAINGNPWWTKPFVGDAYSVVSETSDCHGRDYQFVRSPVRTRPVVSSKWQTNGWQSRLFRDIAIIKWRWK